MSENRGKQIGRRKTPRSAWQRGQSGNPGGRPKVAAEVRDLARNHGAQAIARLVSLMHAKNESVSVRATEALLDRGYGRPTQATSDTSPAGSLPTTEQKPVDFRKLSDEEWATLKTARQTLEELLEKARGESNQSPNN